MNGVRSANASTLQEKSSRINSVELEGLAVMKIVKHCEENYPMTVIGQLLGLDVDQRLEITNCYPFIPPPGAVSGAGPDSSDSQSFDMEQMQYQREMMWFVREINVDHQVAGWYQSTGSQMGSFLTAQWIETQYQYQKNLKNVVCLVYDPVRTEEGTLFIRAYRLTTKYMGLHTKGEFTSLAFDRENVDAESIIEEVPIELRNSSLINAALVDLQYRKNLTGEQDVELSRLAISEKPVLEQSMEFLIHNLDQLGKEQSRYSFFLKTFVRNQASAIDRVRKRKAENRHRKSNGESPLPEDDSLGTLHASESSRLDTKMLIKDLETYIDNIQLLASEGILKQYGAHAVQSEE